MLYLKTGYIFCKDEFKLTNAFFEMCLSRGIPTNGGFLVNNDKDNLVYDSKWGLYVYPNLRNVSNKGE